MIGSCICVVLIIVFMYEDFECFRAADLDKQQGALRIHSFLNKTKNVTVG